MTGNNRGWAFGETTSRRGEQVVIGTGWERFHEAPLDIGAWVDFAMGLGVRAVALLGHSFGSPKVVYYQARPTRSSEPVASPGVRALPYRGLRWTRPASGSARSRLRAAQGFSVGLAGVEALGLAVPGPGGDPLPVALLEGTAGLALGDEGKALGC